MHIGLRIASLVALSLAALPALAQDALPDYSAYRQMATAPKYPQPMQREFIIKDFQFGSGEVLPELRLNYRTIGDWRNPAVLILHGSGGQSGDFLLHSFASEMYGPDQPLDARKHFIILPDNIGHGKSSKPSDGLGNAFPRYSVADSVAAQYRLVTEGLGIKHLRLVMGHSMGGRQTWIWGAQYPDFMDALVPMANSPGAWGRNVAAPDAAVASQQPPGAVEQSFVRESRTVPPPVLENIKAPVLAINSADDAGNAPERARLDLAVARTPHGSFYIIPEGRGTIGHATTFVARVWVKPFKAFFEKVPVRAD